MGLRVLSRSRFRSAPPDLERGHRHAAGGRHGQLQDSSEAGAGGTYAQIGTSATNTFDDSGLTTGSNYFYEVLATDTYSDSLPSAAASITTPTLPPTATMSQINSITNSSISFQWQDNANNEDGYLILRQVGTNGFTILTTLPPDTNPAPSTMTFTDTGLTPGTHYDYHIQSYNLSGYSDFSRRHRHHYRQRPEQPRGDRQRRVDWPGVGQLRRGGNDLQRLPRHDAQRRRDDADRHGVDGPIVY